MGYARIANTAHSSAKSWPLLSVEDVTKSFGRDGAVSNLSFTIGENEIVGLITPTRQGRSTIVDLIAGRIEPTSGSIRIAGMKVSRFEPDGRISGGVACGAPLGNVFPDLTALENVALGAGAAFRPLYSRRGGGTSHDEAAALLEFTGLSAAIDIRADELSASDQRFLMIAIALAAKPALLVLDSPGAGLPRVARMAMALLLGEIRDNGTSVFIAEHAGGPLMDVCDRVLVLNWGRVVAEGAPWRIAPVLDACLGRAPGVAISLSPDSDGRLPPPLRGSSAQRRVVQPL